MGGTISLGEVAGVRLRVSGLWAPALALVLGVLATSWFPQAQAGAGAATYLGLGIVGVALFFLSVGVHELVRVLYAGYRGFDVTRDTLYPFGGVSDLDDALRTPSEEFQLAVVGPLTNFVIAGLATLLQSAFLGQNEFAVALFGYLDRVNVILGLLNLLPAYPLDGGRFLRAVFWNNTGDAAKANRWSLVVAQMIAYALILWGIAQFVLAGRDAGGAALCLVCVGFFVLVAARASIRRALVDFLYADATVRELMRPAPRHIAASATLQQLVDEHLLAGDGGAVPVLKTGRFVGLVTLADARTIARAQWATTPVSAVMRSRDTLVVAAPHQPVRDVIPEIAERGVRQAPVLRDDHLVGMLDRDALFAYLEQRGAAPKEAEQPVATPVGPVS